MKSLSFFCRPLRTALSLVVFLLAGSDLAAQISAVRLDSFGPGSVGQVVPGSSWEGQTKLEGDALIVAGTARDDNGWQARGLNLNAGGTNVVAVTGYRLADNLAGMLVIELQDAALNTAVFSAPLSAFGTASTTVRIPLQAWAAGFDFTRITGWSIGGGVPPPGNEAFRMVFEHLELATQVGVVVPSLPLITVPPVAKAAPLDTEVSFSVAASGNPVPTFQWRREGLPIPGATGAVLTLMVTADTVGRYSVAAQNSVGSVLSAPVVLSVGSGSTSGPIAGTTGGGAPSAGGSTTGSVAGPAGGGTPTGGGSTTGSVAGPTGGGAPAAGGATAGPVAIPTAGSRPTAGGSTTGAVALPTIGGAPTAGGATTGAVAGTAGGGTPAGGGSTTGSVSVPAVGGAPTLGSSTTGAVAGTTPGGTPTAGGASAVSAPNPGSGGALAAGGSTSVGPAGVTPRSEIPEGGNDFVPGAYFGTLPDSGVWALSIRADRRGVFLADFPASGTVAIAEVTLSADNRFQVTGTTLAPRSLVAAAPGAPATASAPVSFTLRAQVSAGNATGELLGYALAAPVDRGPLATAGLYRAQALYTADGGTHVIVGPSGRVFAVTTSAQAVDAVSGNLSSDGHFRALSRLGAEVMVGLNAGTRALTLGYTPAEGARTTVFHGLRDTETTTAALVNLSIRTVAGTAEQSLVAGFVVTGGSKSVLVRGIGPSLEQFGGEGALRDPRLELRRPGTEAPLAGNDDWTEAAGHLFPRLGAFALPGGSRDAALVTELEASSYTALLNQSAGGSGVALLELYDANATGGGRLTNLSARSLVSPDSGPLIAGFNLTGTGTRRLLIRAIGPSLEAFGLEGALPDPRLELYSAGGAVPLATNQDWSPALAETFRQVGAFPLQGGSWDAAFVVTLTAGTYTAQVRSSDGASGIALVEIYELP